jgi:predicted nucleic acid-binding protein
MASHHFLDANILIGSLVEWDGQHRHTHRYMQQEGFRRHTSERVHRECTGVLGRLRRTVLQYLEYMERNLPTRIP